MRDYDDLCKEVEALRDENRKQRQELHEHMQTIASLKADKRRLDNWVEILIQQLPRAK